MDPETARAIAHSSHIGRRDRHGRHLSERVERLAGAVAPDARAVAFLHDLLETTDTSYEALRAHGLTAVEADALGLLTRVPEEPYALYALRIARAPGPAGRLAREVKRADLDDHLAASVQTTGAPLYAWARRHIMLAQERRDERSRDFSAALTRSGRCAARTRDATVR